MISPKKTQALLKELSNLHRECERKLKQPAVKTMLARRTGKLSADSEKTN